MMYYVIFTLVAYLLGSIPTAIWIGKMRYGIDIREHGSKNAGATNTFRVLGKKPGIVVLCIDVIKGFAATFLPKLILLHHIPVEQIVNIQLLAGVFAVIGHILPVFEHFKGGKGVATSLGVVIGIVPYAAAICLLLFLLVFILFHFVSLGAICAALAFPFVLEFIVGNDFFWLRIFSMVLSSSVLFSHRKNMKRLLQGSESKMNLFKK